MGISMNKSNNSQKPVKINTKFEVLDFPCILEDYNTVYNEFKKDLLESIPPTLPCSNVALEKLIALKIYSHLSQFLYICNEKQIGLEALGEYIKLFECKGKAIEGYFRYMNDYASMRRTHDIKACLVNEYFNEESNGKKIVSKYYKLAKGTYELQGYEELKCLMKIMDIDIAHEILAHQYEENMNRLKAMYKEIIFGHIIDKEIYEQTIRLNS
ncbi:hypothetical protein SteCoe_19208 [Stentor coeruleus]|uniref:Uncharacterized protein n=1 Tax=Stentor coeruleus TaxID=5963 RepID=A0A1R2BUL2_9CILI|nr:hypothetical protein SteCoe_19208 [Stentor coeruleus]